MLTLWSALGAPERLRFLVASALAAVAATAGVALLGLSGWFLVAGALAGTAGLGHAFNHLYPSAGVRGAAFTRVLARYAEQLAGHDAILGLSARLRPRIFAAGAHGRRGLAPMVSSDLAALIDDIGAAEGAFLKVVLPGIGVLSGFAVALAFALASDPLLFAIAALAAILTAVVLPYRAVRRARRAAEALTGRADAARGIVARLIENATELDVYGALAPQSVAAEASLSDWHAHAELQDRPFRGSAAVVSAIGVSIAALALWRAATTGGDIPLATGAALASMAAFEAAAAMLRVLEAAPRARAASRRLERRLGAEAAAWDAPLETAATIHTVFPLEVHELRASAAAEAPATAAVNFRIEAGTVTELTGPSGIGKSTFAETLMRLHPLHSGGLRYGGAPAENVRIAAVLARIAMSPQVPAFLPGTVSSQLRLAKPDASEAEMRCALRAALAEEFVMARPAGLETPIGENSTGFSGGELRRLSLARALLAAPELLILDEPLAGLDRALGERLVESLSAWLAGGARAILVLQHAPGEVEWAAVRVQRVALDTVAAA